MQLDLLDKKIVYELGINPRQSYRELAKKIGSKKEVVAYRFNLLMKEKIIKKFVPVFALTSLGIYSGKIYINLKGIKNEKEIIDWLINNTKVAWVARAVGKWDLLIGFYYKNIVEFSQIKEEILFRLGDSVSNYDISLISDGIVFNRDYLLGKETSQRKEFIFGGQIDNVELDEIDKKIIFLIKNDGRFEYTDLAKKLDLDARTILQRINALKERGVLQGFTAFMDLNKIDYKLHKLCIYLNSLNKKNIEGVVKLLKNNTHLIHLIKSVGSWEIEAEVEYKTLDEVYNYIKYLKSEMSNSIKKIDLVTISDEVKLEFFPNDINKE